jgi:hypothetical protein
VVVYPRPVARREGWIWGIVLSLALVGGAVGAADWLGRGPQRRAPEALDLDEALAVPAPDAASPMPPGFVPDLPAVPRLPPGTRVQRAPAPVENDPRLEGLGAEMRLIGEARRVLADDPTGALLLLEQHRAHHPQGALREEREAYAVEALSALGRASEAERRYTEFLEDFPDSSFRSRLVRAMR